MTGPGWLGGKATATATGHHSLRDVSQLASASIPGYDHKRALAFERLPSSLLWNTVSNLKYPGEATERSSRSYLVGVSRTTGLRVAKACGSYVLAPSFKLRIDVHKREGFLEATIRSISSPRMIFADFSAVH